MNEASIQLCLDNPKLVSQERGQSKRNELFSFLYGLIFVNFLTKVKNNSVLCHAESMKRKYALLVQIKSHLIFPCHHEKEE